MAVFAYPPSLHPTPRTGRHVGSLPSALTIPPSCLHMDTRTNWWAGSRPVPTPPLPAGCWPTDRGHVARPNASRCWAFALTDLALVVCLPEKLLARNESQKKKKIKEGVLFFHSSDLRRLPCSQPSSDSPHCCLFSRHLSPLAAIVGFWNFFHVLLLLLLLLLLLWFLDNLPHPCSQRRMCLLFCPHL